MLRQDNSVRRMDLNLRLEYIGLDTEIYKLTAYQYCIYCKNVGSQFELIVDKFNNEIRQMGTNVILVDRRPSVYIEQLENINMDNPVDSFKASVITEPELQEFIRGMFPEVDIIRIIIEPGLNFNIVIEVEENTTDEVCDEMKRVLLIRDIETDDIKIRKVRKEKKAKKDELTTNNERLDAFFKSMK